MLNISSEAEGSLDARMRKAGLAEYKRLYGGRDDAAPGWDAIDACLREVYGDQEPRHRGTVIKHVLGGPGAAPDRLA